MNIMYKLKHYTNRVLYTFLGPADLDEHNDPSLRLKREYAEKQKDEVPAPAAGPAPEPTTAEALPSPRSEETKAIA